MAYSPAAEGKKWPYPEMNDTKLNLVSLDAEYSAE